MTPGHLVFGMSCLDFICTGLEANQMPKKSAFGYYMKHTKMNEWSRKDSSPHSDLRGHIPLVPTYIDWNPWPSDLVVNIEVVELIWIDFENRHCLKFSIYSRYFDEKIELHWKVDQTNWSS